MPNKEIFLLNKIGLTDAEAKVYLGLLKNGSSSGYEASKVSAVPRSKIYNILESLVIKGFILYSESESTNKYAAVPIAEIVKKVEHETKNTLDELIENLKDYPMKTDLEYIWHIRQNENVFAKCRDVINGTKDELLIQIWEEDLPQVLSDLQILEKNGVRMGIILFSRDENPEVPLKKYYRHGLIDKKMEEMGGRWVTLVSDMEEVVFGQIISNNTAEVIWTKSKPLIALAAECVRHDVYFYKNATIFHDVMQKEFGKEFEKIRDIFY